MLAAVAFLDAFQKVADMATNTRGGEGGVAGGGGCAWWAGRLERDMGRGKDTKARMETLASAVMAWNR